MAESKKEVISKIMLELKKDSKYMYREGLEKVMSDMQIWNLGHIEISYMRNLLAVSDAWIVYAVNRLGACDLGILSTFLLNLSRLAPNKPIPSVEISSLINRVSLLAREGCLRAFTYRTDVDGRSVLTHVYTASDVGVKWMNAILDRQQERANPVTSMYPLDDTLRILACDYVASALYDNKYVKDFVTNKELYIGDKYPTLTTYAQLYFRRDDIDYMLYVHPLFFNFSSKHYTDGEYKNRLKQEIGMLSRHINSKKMKEIYKDMKVVFVVENTKGLANAINYILKYAGKDFLESQCWFTSESVIYFNKMDVKRSFLSIRIGADNSPIVDIAAHDVFLKGEGILMRALSNGEIGEINEDEEFFEASEMPDEEDE